MSTLNDPALLGDGYTTLSVASILEESAARYPENPALHFAGDTISYHDLWMQARAYAGGLRARGIARGDRVGLMIPNVPDFPRVYYAVLALGAIVVPIHSLLKREEIEFVLRDAQVDLLVAAAPFLPEALPASGQAGVPLVTVLLPAGTAPSLPRLEDESATAPPLTRPVPTGPLEPATILYTSGTTGTPKGSVASHLSIVEQVHCSLIDSLDMRRDDVVFGGLPLFHTFGQTAVMNTSFRRGASVVLLPRFDPDEALRLMVSHRVTVLAAVPTMFVELLEAATRSSQRPTLRFAVSGGSALPTPLLVAFADAFGADVHEGYGLTETTPIVAFNTVEEPIRPGTVGRSMWGVRVAIADPDLEDSIEFVDASHAKPGEIIVQGHNLFKGYLGKEDATRSVVVDGWFRTGDLGFMDDGVLTIVDRKKDMILRNGYNVYPREVEEVLSQHPAVAMAAVFGVDDSRHGQEIHAVVVLRENRAADAAALQGYAREHMAAYKYPRVIHIAGALPTNASGKILRRELAKTFAASGDSAAEQIAM